MLRSYVLACHGVTLRWHTIIAMVPELPGCVVHCTLALCLRLATPRRLASVWRRAIASLASTATDTRESSRQLATSITYTATTKFVAAI